METIQTERAPKAVGPYSQAVRAGEFLFLSGQISLDPETAEVVGSDIETQTRQVLKNMQAIISAANMSLTNVVKTTVFLTDIAEFPKVNAVYQSFFGSHRPARTTVQVSALPKGVRIELDAICVDREVKAQ